MPSKTISTAAYGGYLLHAGMTLYAAGHSARRFPFDRAAGVIAGSGSGIRRSSGWGLVLLGAALAGTL